MSNKLHLVPQVVQDIAKSIVSESTVRNQNYVNSKIEQLEETMKFCEKFLASLKK